MSHILNRTEAQLKIVTQQLIRLIGVDTTLLHLIRMACVTYSIPINKIDSLTSLIVDLIKKEAKQGHD